ncbi:MAG: ABC transporter permease subunit [Spirochaetales bacterium]|nr:ABC transporter permease subunit [Spirochaetales bacterium]
MKKSKPTFLILSILSIILLILGYSWLSMVQHQKNPSDTTIPNLPQLMEGLKTIFQANAKNGEVWFIVDGAATLSRLFYGLTISIVLSTLIGLAMGSFRFVEALLMPALRLFAKMTPTAMLAVFFVMVGTGLEMYVTMIAFGIIPTLAQSVYLAVKEVPEENLYKASTLGATTLEIIYDVIYKQVLPKIIDAIRLQIGPAMVFLIAAEMVVGSIGFGYRIRLQSRLLNMSVVYPYIIFLAAFGFSIDSLLKLATKRLCPWYNPAK